MLTNERGKSVALNSFLPFQNFMGILPFPLPYPVASQGVSILITGDILKLLPCVAQPYRGGVTKGRRGYKNEILAIQPPPLSCPVALRGVAQQYKGGGVPIGRKEGVNLTIKNYVIFLTSLRRDLE